jgi:hypothetical protein
MNDGHIWDIRDIPLYAIYIQPIMVLDHISDLWDRPQQLVADHFGQGVSWRRTPDQAPAELGDVMWAVARVFANPRVAQLASRRFATKEQVAVTDVAGQYLKIWVCLKTGVYLPIMDTLMGKMMSSHNWKVYPSERFWF